MSDSQVGTDVCARNKAERRDAEKWRPMEVLYSEKDYITEGSKRKHRDRDSELTSDTVASIKREARWYVIEALLSYQNTLQPWQQRRRS